MNLLVEALLSEEPRAREVWAAWRAEIDIDMLPYSDQQLFAALSPAFPDWLERDPAAAILNGVVRQAWSQNQLCLQRTVELNDLFQKAGITALIAGPLAWALKTPRPAIRPIPYFTFLVPREQARKARELLTDTGWEPTFDFPPDQWWDRRGHVRLRRANLGLNLHWRLLPVPPEDARECEQVFLSRTERISWNQHTLQTISPEATLLHILSGERDGDLLPWQADVALVGPAGMNWALFLELARRFAPPASHGYASYVDTAAWQFLSYR